ncbi:hypothetical protein [Bradyrhizobium sp. CB3481]|uniref:hypothetical protein n=1 Tax=Bradyrhizobium sp. CB3481 TaxID=3039158 RepID=UPI0024B0AB2E|nr:hypothetical protein [Bradyrhizobium sp. CB3481]WFU14826.1 hypothetical protein QA643_27760 [Bradyrhizobium sp. CB3481]
MAAALAAGIQASAFLRLPAFTSNGDSRALDTFFRAHTPGPLSGYILIALAISREASFLYARKLIEFMTLTGGRSGHPQSL